MPGECCPPERSQALRATCTASLDVCCLHPNSTDQYSSTNLESLSCGPNGGPRLERATVPPPQNLGAEEECNVNDCRSSGTGCCVDKPGACSEDDLLFGSCEEPRFEEELESNRPPVRIEPRCGTRNSFGTASVKVV